MRIDRLQRMMAAALSMLEIIDETVSASLSQNEQFLLDFYDRINEISVRK